jgi:hypothetical protein
MHNRRFFIIAVRDSSRVAAASFAFSHNKPPDAIPVIVYYDALTNSMLWIIIVYLAPGANALFLSLLLILYA